ncbi:MAG: diaminopimelate epimerase [Betaproteobacteria bacterium]|nr:diaminopimelate epimerase [Betaproteobacteria bacterium]
MSLRFTKMHGQGNDFVMLNGVSQTISLSPAQIQRIADRHFGIGCDQLLLVELATNANADFRYRIFNADGGEVEQCGNGARCFAQFVRDEGLTTKQEIRVETLSGLIVPRIEADGRVTVNMGPPRFIPAEIPFKAEVESLKYALDVRGTHISIGAVSMGNPHAVQVVANVDTAPVRETGPLIENHEKFPNRVNAGFLQIVDRGHVRLRVWERGAGETLACGTGACAAVVTGIRWGLLDSSVVVFTRGGELTVTWQGGDDKSAPVLMSGATATVFKGEIAV